MAWFHAVSLESGLDASQLEILFGMPKTKEQQYVPGARPGLWGKYRDGVICPKFKPDSHGRPSIVERVEKKFPGTAKWMNMPFWDVLSEAQMGMDDLKRVYVSLSRPVCQLIVSDTPSEPKFFWRRPIYVGKLCKYLTRARGLDATTAVLALIKEAEATQNQNMHRELLGRWAPFAAWLRNHPVLSAVANNINQLIEDRFTVFEYLDEDGEYFSLTREQVRALMAGEPVAV